MKAHRLCRGVTLLEMMVTLVILATLISLGLPEIQDFISRQGVVNESNRLLADIRFARVESARRGQEIRVCAFDTNNDCDGAPACSCQTGASGREYHTGWLVFVDANGDGVMATADDDVLLRVGARTARGDLEMRGSNLARDAGFRFSPSGALHATDFNASNNGVGITSCENGVSTSQIPGLSLFVRPAGNFVNEKIADGDTCAIDQPS